MKKFIFDVDGTLTPSRKQIEHEFWAPFLIFCRHNDVYLVTGSDRQKTLEQLGLVLIDEASMIDSTLLDIILQSAHAFKTRLVFVGDVAQLPPVGEAFSPVFAIKRAVKEELKEVYFGNTRLKIIVLITGKA